MHCNGTKRSRKSFSLMSYPSNLSVATKKKVSLALAYHSMPLLSIFLRFSVFTWLYRFVHPKICIFAVSHYSWMCQWLCLPFLSFRNNEFVMVVILHFSHKVSGMDPRWWWWGHVTSWVLLGLKTLVLEKARFHHLGKLTFKFLANVPLRLPWV